MPSSEKAHPGDPSPPAGGRWLGLELRGEAALLHVLQALHRGAEADLVALLQLAALKAADLSLHVGRAAAHGLRDVQGRPAEGGERPGDPVLGAVKRQDLAGLMDTA